MMQPAPVSQSDREQFLKTAGVRDMNEYAERFGWGRYAAAAGLVSAAEVILIQKRHAPKKSRG